MIDRHTLTDARDSALNDEAGLHRALRIVKIFYIVYGKHPVAGNLLRELADILIAVRMRARERHQAAEEAAEQY